MSYPVVHDGRRCPDCDSHGTIKEFHTSKHAGNDQSRVRSRIYECDECETEWENYD